VVLFLAYAVVNKNMYAATRGDRSQQTGARARFQPRHHPTTRSP